MYEHFRPRMFLSALEGLEQEVDDMAREMQRLPAMHSVSEEERSALGSYFSMIRGVLGREKDGPRCGSGSGSEIAVRVLELAGMIKALRNDLDQVLGRMCA